MTLKDKAKVQVGIVNQSLDSVLENLNNIEVTNSEPIQQREKLGIKTQLFARIDFHMDVARKALDALDQTLANR